MHASSFKIMNDMYTNKRPRGLNTLRDQDPRNGEGLYYIYKFAQQRVSLSLLYD